MQSEVEACTKREQVDFSLTKKMHGVLENFRATLFAGTNLAPSEPTGPSARCQVADSRFALPALKLTDPENKSATLETPERQALLVQSNQDLRKLVGNERLKQCIAVLSKLPVHKEEDFLLTDDAILNDSKANPDPAKRKLLASQLIDQVTHPERINQGLKGTCAAAGVEVDMAVAQPDSYAKSVYSWSKLIETSAPGNKDDVDSISKNPTAIVERDDSSHNRSLVSRIFQTGTINLALAPQGQKYEGFSVSEAPDIKTFDGAFKPDRDTGERVIDGNNKVLTWTGLSAPDQARVLTQLSPDDYISEKLHPTSPTDLMNALNTEITKDRAPVNVGVQTVYAGHSITILKVDPKDKSHEISYINTAAPGNKVSRMSAQHLYDATISGDDVVRIGAAGQLDGMPYRKAFKLGADAHPDVIVVHKKNS